MNTSQPKWKRHTPRTWTLMAMLYALITVMQVNDSFHSLATHDLAGFWEHALFALAVSLYTIFDIVRACQAIANRSSGKAHTAASPSESPLSC